MRRISSHGTTFEEALVIAIADLAGCDREKVELAVNAPGLDAISGEVDLRLAIGSASEEPAPETGGGERRDEAAEDEITVEDLDAEAETAADFLEGLLDAFDLPGDLRIRVHDDRAEIELVEVGGGALIGRRGQTLEAIQELLRCMLQREYQRRARVHVDVEGYRARRLEKLLDKAQEAIDAVLEDGQAQRLEPMDVFERKAVHQLVSDVPGLSSRSQGREPSRRIVIEPEDA